MKLYTVYHEIGGEWFPTCEVPMSREDALKEADELLRLQELIQERIDAERQLVEKE